LAVQVGSKFHLRHIDDVMTLFRLSPAQRDLYQESGTTLAELARLTEFDPQKVLARVERLGTPLLGHRQKTRSWGVPRAVRKWGDTVVIIGGHSVPLTEAFLDQLATEVQLMKELYATGRADLSEVHPQLAVASADRVGMEILELELRDGLSRHFGQSSWAVYHRAHREVLIPDLYVELENGQVRALGTGPRPHPVEQLVLQTIAGIAVEELHHGAGHQLPLGIGALAPFIPRSPQIVSYMAWLENTPLSELSEAAGVKLPDKDSLFAELPEADYLAWRDSLGLHTTAMTRLTYPTRRLYDHWQVHHAKKLQRLSSGQ
jgi:hypothetical protein